MKKVKAALFHVLSYGGFAFSLWSLLRVLSIVPAQFALVFVWLLLIWSFADNIAEASVRKHADLCLTCPGNVECPGCRQCDNEGDDGRCCECRYDFTRCKFAQER